MFVYPKDWLYFRLQFCLVLFHTATPDKSVAVGCRFHFGAIDILYIQTFATEIIDRAEIGSTITRQPHEVNIFLQGFLYFATGIDIVQVGIKQDFEHHTGMVTAGASSFICPEQTAYIQGVYNTGYNTNGMIGNYLFR